jgi:hypothetical protein
VLNCGPASVPRDPVAEPYVTDERKNPFKRHMLSPFTGLAIEVPFLRGDACACSAAMTLHRKLRVIDRQVLYGAQTER